MIAIAASASDCNDDNNDGSNRAVEVVAIAMTMIAKMIVVVAISKLSPSLKRKERLWYSRHGNSDDGGVNMKSNSGSI